MAALIVRRSGQLVETPAASDKGTVPLEASECVFVHVESVGGEEGGGEEGGGEEKEDEEDEMMMMLLRM